MSRRSLLIIAVLFVCVSAALSSRMLLQREFVGEFPKAGYRTEKAVYVVKVYEPPTPPVPFGVPTLDVRLADNSPIQLNEIPIVTPLGRIDIAGDLKFEKTIRADVIISAVLWAPNVSGSDPVSVAYVNQMLTPHKGKQFQLKMPIPAAKGSYRFEINVLSPDLKPMRRILATGVVEVR